MAQRLKGSMAQRQEGATQGRRAKGAEQRAERQELYVTPHEFLIFALSSELLALNPQPLAFLNKIVRINKILKKHEPHS